MNEILLYSEITADTAQNFIQQLDWIGDSAVCGVRMYTPGGDVQAAWGMWAKIQEAQRRGCRFIAKVDGMAFSMGSFLLCAFDEREALDTSQLMIHRAILDARDAEGNSVEPSADDKFIVGKINDDLKSRLSKLIDDKKLRALKGYGIREIFDENKDRLNCFLTAEEALQIGLISKIIPIDAVTSQTYSKAVAACYKATAATAEKPNANKMTKDEFKKENPDEAKALAEEAVEAYKAEEAKKAKAAKAEKDDEEEDPDDTEEAKKAKKEAKKTANAVVEVLKAMGIQDVTASAVKQTAEATAKAQAEAAAQKTAVEKEAEDFVKFTAELKSGKITY